jgi:hypothetical protein
MFKPAKPKHDGYHEVLRDRARDVLEQFGAVPAGAEDDEFQSILETALTETAKESFKAGIEVGRKKAGQVGQRPKQA